MTETGIPRRIMLTTDSVGGIWQYCLELSRSLSEQQCEVILAVLGPPPSDEQRAAAQSIKRLILCDTGLPLEWLAEDQQTLDRSGAALAALAERHGAQLVQLNMPALGSAVDFPCPVVAVAHSCVGTWWQANKAEAVPDDFAWKIERTGAGLRRAQQVVAPSRAFAEATKATHSLPALPAVVYNGRRCPAPAEGTVPADHVFTAGRLWDQGKNVRTLDRAASLLDLPFRAAGPLAGPHGERIALQHIAALGTLDDAGVARELAAQPIYASAALYEPFGLSVLEAAAAGCALVLSDIPTFRELWDDAAIFVAPMDEGGFATAIAQMIADPALRLQRAANARERAARFTVEAMSQGMMTIYRAALSAADTPALTLGKTRAAA